MPQITQLNGLTHLQNTLAHQGQKKSEESCEVYRLPCPLHIYIYMNFSPPQNNTLPSFSSHSISAVEVSFGLSSLIHQIQNTLKQTGIFKKIEVGLDVIDGPNRTPAFSCHPSFPDGSTQIQEGKYETHVQLSPLPQLIETIGQQAKEMFEKKSGNEGDWEWICLLPYNLPLHTTVKNLSSPSQKEEAPQKHILVTAHIQESMALVREGIQKLEGFEKAKIKVNAEWTPVGFSRP